MNAAGRSLPRRLVVVLALCLMPLIASTSSGGSSVTAKGAPLTLYVTNDLETPSFVPLDPMTLADDAAAAPLTFDEDYPAWTVSGDGSTLVFIEGAGGLNPIARVENATTRTVRYRFSIPRELYDPKLTMDGRLLILQVAQNGNPSGVSRPAWYVFSTTDGRQVSKIVGEGQGITPFSFHYTILDPAGERLYVPFVPGEKLSDGPLPLQIAVYDLRSGLETGRIELPNVLAGSWFPPEQGDLGIVNDALTPGVALSLQGRELAVVDGVTGRITIIDARSMQIAREFVPKQPVSRLERLLGWLSFAPESTEAKLMEGTVLGATYSADGRSLYVTGRSVEVGATMDEIEAGGLGIRRIDLRSEEIAAESLDGIDIAEVWATTDGSALYVYGYDKMWETANGDVDPHLRRLDPDTLEVEADRALPDQAWVVAAPLAPISTT